VCVCVSGVSARERVYSLRLSLQRDRAKWRGVDKPPSAGEQLSCNRIQPFAAVRHVEDNDEEGAGARVEVPRSQLAASAGGVKAVVLDGSATMVGPPLRSKRQRALMGDG
jgi:hypothetical protein